MRKTHKPERSGSVGSYQPRLDVQLTSVARASVFQLGAGLHVPSPACCGDSARDRVRLRCRQVRKDEVDATTATTSTVWWHKLLAHLIELDQSFSLAFDRGRRSLNLHKFVFESLRCDTHDPLCFCRRSILILTLHELGALFAKCSSAPRDLPFATTLTSGCLRPASPAVTRLLSPSPSRPC